MKVIQMYAPGDLRFEEAPLPEVGADEVLVKVMACGVCGSDLPRMLTYGAHVSPIIPGHEFSGEAVKIGAEVEGWNVGDRAVVAPLIPCNECEWCKKGIFALCENYKYYGSRNDGGFAQYCAVKAANLLHTGDLRYDHAATIDPAANALHAFFRGEGTAEDTVCVYGLGAIGLFCVQYARALGCKQIIAVDITDEKLALAKECGATDTVNSLKEDPARAVQALTNGGANLVLEVSGAPVAQNSAILSARKMGRVVYLGISHAAPNFSEKAMDYVQRAQLALLGSWNSFSLPFPGREWTESLRLMQEGRLNPEAVISHRLPLDQLPDTFKQIKAKTLKFNKILFYPNGDF